MMLRSMFLVGLSATVVGCGDGDFRVNPSAGELSTVGGSGAGAGTAQAYFATNIFPVMTANTGNKGCLGTGCHSPISDQTFFQLDASSSSISYNWAGIRRTGDPTPGTFASSSSDRILDRKTANHNTFQNWNTAEKGYIDTWSAMTE